MRLSGGGCELAGVGKEGEGGGEGLSSPLARVSGSKGQLLGAAAPGVVCVAQLLGAPSPRVVCLLSTVHCPVHCPMSVHCPPAASSVELHRAQGWVPLRSARAPRRLWVTRVFDSP